MDLILWRHAEAADGTPDLARELTQQANPPFLFSQSQYGRLFVRAQDAFLMPLVQHPRVDFDAKIAQAGRLLQLFGVDANGELAGG